MVVKYAGRDENGYLIFDTEGYLIRANVESILDEHEEMEVVYTVKEGEVPLEVIGGMKYDLTAEGNKGIEVKVGVTTDENDVVTLTHENKELLIVLKEILEEHEAMEVVI